MTATACQTGAAMTPLAESIEHWKENVAKAKAGTLTTEDIAGKNCALCRAHDECEGCPVAELTEEDDCEGASWHDLNLALREGDAHQRIVHYAEGMLRVLEDCADTLSEEAGKR